jgi:hypothetical protein
MASIPALVLPMYFRGLHAAADMAPVMWSVSAMRPQGDRAEQIADEQSCCSTGLSSYREAWTSQRIPIGDAVNPNDPEIDTESVSAGHRVGGAPRRNRTADPILTMDLAVTDVPTSASAGRWRP